MTICPDCRKLAHPGAIHICSPVPSLADDLRRAAIDEDALCAIASKKDGPVHAHIALQHKALANRLRAHADTIERVEKEMRPYENLEGPIANWYDALKGDVT